MLLKNSIAVIILKNRIIPYSPTKIRAKGPLEYSVLNPETSSDSPSEKSNGARLHSATQDKYQIRRTGNVNIIREHVEIFFKSYTDKKLFNKMIQNNVREKEISYEMDWEILRTLPNILNLEFDLHPDSRVL